LQEKPHAIIFDNFFETRLIMNKHLLETLPKPLVFAHRGASKYAPENTLASFRLAIEQGARAIELDAMLSADNKVVVIHDSTLNRTTNSEGEVNKCPLLEIKKLDAGSWYSEEYSCETIPLLEEVLEEFGGECLLNIELKNYHSPKDLLIEEVATLVNKMHLQNSVMFSSFLPVNIRKIKRRLIGARVALLALSGLPGNVMRSFFFQSLSPEFIHIAFQDVSGEYIRKEHKRGRRVHVYTVNDAKLMQDLFEAGVDGIFTNDPRLAFDVLRIN